MNQNEAAIMDAMKIAYSGALRHDGPGRTDDLPLHLHGESFVIPADAVSALGQGNTAAGFKLLEHLFPPSAQPAQSEHGKVPVVVAGGEFVCPPEHVKRVGDGDIKRGHKVLEAFVLNIRKQAIKQLRKLPKPAKR